MTDISVPKHSFCQIYFHHDRYSRAQTQLWSNLFPTRQLFQSPHTASVKFISYMTVIPEPTHSFCQIYFLHDNYSRAHTQLLSNLFPTWQIFQSQHTDFVKFISTMTGISEPTHSLCQIYFLHDRYFSTHTQLLSNLFPPWQAFQSPHTSFVKIYLHHDMYSRAHT